MAMSLTVSLLLVVGSIYLLEKAFFLFSLISLLYGPHLRDLTDLGEWTCITGATDGIGKEIALLAAKQCSDLNLLLIARNEEKLNKVSKELRELPRYCGKVVVIVHDFSQGNAKEQYDRLRQSLEKYDIGCLVNNVGQSYSHPSAFDDKEDSFCDRLVDVNILSVLLLSRICVEKMKLRRKGAICCVGSVARLANDPLCVIYPATKRFVHGFCLSLQAECRQNNILVQCAEPGPVRTELTKHWRDTALKVSAESCADYILRAIRRGRISPAQLSTPVAFRPNPIHWSAAIWVSLAPRTMVEGQRYRSRMEQIVRANKKE